MEFVANFVEIIFMLLLLAGIVFAFFYCLRHRNRISRWIEHYDDNDNKAEKEFIYWLGVARVIQLQIGSNKSQISIDDETEEVTLDVPPIIVSSRTFVPLRFIATAFGAQVTWQASDQSILIEFQGKRLTLWIGLNYAIMVHQKDGQVVTQTMDLDQAPFIRAGRTLVPLRFIAEAFGAKVEYEAPTQTITLSMITLE